TSKVSMLSTCGTASEFNGEYMGARIASVFVLLALSAAGSFFPLLAINYKFFRIPDIVIFLTRYFGSGVIVATAFIHLLGESQTSLSHPCVGEIFLEYSWSAAFSLMGVVLMFTIEAFTHRRLDRRNRLALLLCGMGSHDHEKAESHEETTEICVCTGESSNEDSGTTTEVPSTAEAPEKAPKEAVIKALVNIYLLEFGIVFHSIFVGLSLAIAGEGFKTLFVAISFHQFFEGMGIGARFATAKWPEHLKRIPWYLSAAYTVTTPIGIAAGLGVRNLYLENSPVSLIVVGVFDGFCSGLLIYNSLVELMARDFISDPLMKNISNFRFALAYGMFLTGALMMSIVGKWA
ncbi:ZIP zinc/iron transport family, partial [Metschnikowia bicuspidata var. bicuspidata NRRL YB-4993]